MKPALVKIDTAAADLGQSIRRVEQLVEGGTPDEAGLLFVFNLAVNPTGRIRALRFWRPELEARAAGDGAAIRKMSLEIVIGTILPARRAFFQAGELDQLFQFRPNTRIDLHGELKGERRGSHFIYRRALLATFLETRWLGHLERTTK